MTALAGAHLELSARLGSRHRRRRSPLPRRARRGRWRASRLGGGRGCGGAFRTGVDASWQRSTVKASYSRNGRSLPGPRTEPTWRGKVPSARAGRGEALPRCGRASTSLRRSAAGSGRATRETIVSLKPESAWRPGMTRGLTLP